MTTTDNEAMSALHQLLDERQRYQAWLTTLESRRNSTPPHVYDRVQKDYAARLDGVMQNLAHRAEQLGGTIQAMTIELSTLRNHEADRTDERHEAELRAMVGEFTPEEWDRRRSEADSELERIAAERHSLEAELEELQRIVALTGSINAAPDFIDGMQSSAPSSVELTNAGSSIPGVHESDRGGESAAAPSIEQFASERNPPMAEQNMRAEAPRDALPVPDTAGLGDSVVSATTMGGNPAGADYGLANGVIGGDALTSVRAPAALGDSRRETDKTLKCPECGTMNYATEWYCERCGGELSAF